MNDAARQGNAQQRWVGALLVLALHVGLFYALVSGLKPHAAGTRPPAFEVTLLSEIHKPSPEPLKPQSPPVALPAVTAPPVVPPPEVQVPAVQNHAISAVVAPLPAQAVALAPTAPKARLRVGVNPIYIPPVEELQRRYPREARREGLSGRVLLRLTVAPNGEVVNAVVRQGTPAGLFDTVALDYVRRFRFEKGAEEFFVDQELVFKLDQ
ncbi:MAG: energy transducer TonB [Betaproteobacteria bacterium]|nr:energy transducer TonB [Betaproteobacteria bacterium]